MAGALWAAVDNEQMMGKKTTKKENNDIGEGEEKYKDDTWQLLTILFITLETVMTANRARIYNFRS